MKGIASILLLILVIGVFVGGYFLYQSQPQVRSFIESSLNISLPKEDVVIGPLSLARDQERREGVKLISDTIVQYTSEKKGLPPKDFPTEEKCIGTGSDCYNLKAILVPIFIDEIPMDPQTGTEENTGFTTFKGEDGRIVVRVKGENGGVFEMVR
jgi:hypothetical protein